MRDSIQQDAQSSVGFLGRIDESILARLAIAGPDTQRWLRTALYAVRTIEPAIEAQQKEKLSKPSERGERLRVRPGLEDMLSGDADLQEVAKAYPELAEELDGIADILDRLRDLGSRRRRMGEEILHGSEGDEDEKTPPSGTEV